MYLLPISPDNFAFVGVRGTTPLHLAAAKGHTKIAELLIEAGADVNCKDRDGTPLDNAVRFKQNEVAELLRQHGAKE
jgi:ankyrin repeat protein